MSLPIAPPYPVFLDIRDMPVLVVGGGAVAARKVADLVESAARVTVVSPQFDPAIVELGARDSESLRLQKRLYRPSDLKGKRLVFAATDNIALNQSICKAAQASGAFTNCAAPPDAGIFTVPATVKRGAFCLAVATGGASAALSAHWRKRLEKLAGPEWGELVALLEKKRLEIKARVADPAIRRTLLSTLGKAHWAAKVKKLGITQVEKLMDAVIAKSESKQSLRS